MFRGQYSSSVRCFSGDPDCIAAYQWIQALLRKRNPRWLEASASLTDRQKGNLGEFIAFHVSHEHGYPRPQYLCMTSNAADPLALASAIGLDIVFIYFHETDSFQDKIFIQEVKTTGDPKMGIANKLIEDHRKLIEANIDQNLQSRIQAIKARLELEHGLSQDRLDRVESMSHPVPAKCTQIYFLPTIIHEKTGSDPVRVLEKVKVKIAEAGWLNDNINPVSINLTNLDKGLEALSKNREFDP